MKKLLILFLAVVLLGGCAAAQDPVAEASGVLGLDLSGGRVVRQSDDHGGFQGDGTASLWIAFDDGSSAPAEIAEHWKKLPLTENLTAAAYGISTGDLTRQSLLRDDAGYHLLPEVTNGYYWFYDRRGETCDDADLFNRASYNFTLAIYDTDAGILYYVVLDT